MLDRLAVLAHAEFVDLAFNAGIDVPAIDRFERSLGVQVEIDGPDA